MTRFARSRFLAPDAAAEPDTLAEQTRLLYQGTLLVPFNLVNAIVVAVALRSSFPLPFLIVWLGLTGLVVALRLVLWRRYRRQAENGGGPRPWARRFTAGALVSGALWGSVCLALPYYGDWVDFLFVTLVAAAMSAGAMTSLVPYFPAFLAYLLPFVVPPAIAFIIAPGPDHVVLGLLILLYAVALIGTGWNMKQAVLRTLQLQSANAELHLSLTRTHAELDAVRQDRWSTLAHLSHELRTPLTAILGFSEAIRDQMFGPIGNPQYRDYGQHVHVSGQHLLDLATEILDFSRSEAGALTLSEAENDVGAAIAACLELVSARSQGATLRMTCEIAAELPLLYADATRLRQILLNLLTNAVKFTPPPGAVTVKASLAPDGGVLISVTDTGIGMATEDIPRAMQPFVRLASPLVRQAEGMGLGLPLAKRLMEMHGGILEITSELGRWTTCTARFPAARSRSRHPHAATVR